MSTHTVKYLSSHEGGRPHDIEPTTPTVTKAKQVAPPKLLSPPDTFSNGKSLLYTTYRNYIKYPILAEVPQVAGHTIFAEDIVKIDRVTKQARLSKRYFASDYIDFFSALLDIPLDKRVFYEVIPQGRQKPKFDIEYEYLPQDSIPAHERFDRIVSQVLEGISEEMSSKGVAYSFDSNCLVFSSHGEGKFSVHIVIDKLYHNNSVEAKAFYQAVMTHVDPDLHYFDFHGSQHHTVDPSPYSKNQQFRLLGSSKIKRGRFKILAPMTTYVPGNPGDDDCVKNLRLFAASLVSFTSGCVELPSWVIARPPRVIRPNDNITEDIYHQIINAFEASEFSLNYNVVSDGKDTNVRLRRSQASYCSIHNRVHDHDNGFLTSWAMNPRCSDALR